MSLVRLLLIAALLSSGAARAEVSYIKERELGADFDRMAQERFPLVRDPEFVSYVDEIGQQIAGKLDDSFFEYRFSVLRDRSINAFAVPGGYIYVNVGLILHAKNDDEVAAVLGHEVAHVHAHHMARQQEKTQLINYATLLATLAAVMQPELAPLAAAAGQAAELKYRREFEQEADYLGVRYLKGTGYDPRAMLDFFKKLENQTRLTPSFYPPYLRSHPLTDERLNHLEAVLGAKQWENHERRGTSRRLQRLQALARARYQQPQQVLEDYRRVREDNPGNPQADYLYGVVALETRRFAEARAALEKARAGGVVDADRELGRVALRERRPEDAEALLSAYLEREPKDGMAWVELARAREANDNTDGAMAAYAKAFGAVPALDPAHEGYGLLAGRAGDTAAGHYHLGLAAQLRGEYPRALDHLNKALPSLPEGDPRQTRATAEIAVLQDYLEIDEDEEEPLDP